MVAIGAWTDPWDTSHDEPYQTMLGALRGGLVADGEPIDIHAVAVRVGVPDTDARAAAGRMLDLGLVRLAPGPTVVWTPLSDQEWSTALDQSLRLSTTLVRLGAAAMDSAHRSAVHERTEAVRRAAALRTREFPTSFSAAIGVWWSACPNASVRRRSVLAFDRARYGRYPTIPWSVWDSEAFLTPAEAAADGDAESIDVAADALDDLGGEHLRNVGFPRDESPIEAPWFDPRAHDQWVADEPFQSLLAAIRSERFPAGSIVSKATLVTFTDAPWSELLPALRRLRELGLVEPEAGAVRLTVPTLQDWTDDVGLLAALLWAVVVEVLPRMSAAARAAVAVEVRALDTAARLRSPDYQSLVAGFGRTLVSYSRNHWVRVAYGTTVTRLAYQLPTAPEFRQWNTTPWRVLLTALGSGAVDDARLAARTVVDLLTAHADDVAARYGTMEP